MTKNLIIAIDGHSSCGKSTLARMLAQALDYIYVDSGAMYRAVTLFYLENQIPDHATLVSLLDTIRIGFILKNHHSRTTINEQDVEDKIRTMAVSELVSEISTISAVRKKLVKEQRRLGQIGGIVMDGRDIGTVVFPNADLKIFLTASIDIRTARRHKELLTKGFDLSKDDVRKNLIKRDLMDSTRADSPLYRAKDARILDNTRLDKADQLAIALKWVTELRKK